MKRESVEQRAVVLAMRWMREHTGGLIDDDEVLVLEKYVERNVLLPHRGPARVIHVDLDEVIRAKAVTDILKAPVDLATLAFDDIAKIHFAQRAEMVEQKVLEP